MKRLRVAGVPIYISNDIRCINALTFVKLDQGYDICYLISCIHVNTAKIVIYQRP